MKILFCLVTIFSSMAGAEYNIAVVDIEFALRTTSDGRLAEEKLKREFGLLEKKMKEREYSLMKKVKDFEKKAMLLSETKRAQQQKEIQKLSINFQKDVQEFQTSLQRRQMEATKPIIDKIEEQIAIIAKEKGYDLVLNKSVNSVVWAKDNVDITKRVIKMYEDSKKSS